MNCMRKFMQSVACPSSWVTLLSHALVMQAGWFPAPQPSSFLQPGVVLSGTQLVSRRNRIREDWNVTVNVEVRSQRRQPSILAVCAPIYSQTLLQLGLLGDLGARAQTL